VIVFYFSNETTDEHGLARMRMMIAP
jgi:hypothetical protein